MTKDRKGPKGGESTIYESGLLRKTVYFYPEEWAAIRKAAYEEDKNYTEVIREAVRAYFSIDE
jgi:hypothetical protein